MNLRSPIIAKSRFSRFWCDYVLIVEKLYIKLYWCNYIYYNEEGTTPFVEFIKPNKYGIGSKKYG